MQSMFGPILLTVLLNICQIFQPVAGIDCQDTCATCYQDLAKALIDTENNKYSLSRGFFPPDAVPPVLVKITYNFKNCSTCRSKTWYYTEGAFYIYQPLEVFVFRSLFFSPISIRQGTVDLQLPAECFDAPSEFYQLLTQRLKAYAMFQTATPRVDNNYHAKAVSGDIKLDYKHHEVYGYAYNVRIDQLLHAYQYVPFIIAFGIIVIAFLILLGCLYFTCENGLRKNISQGIDNISKDSKHQATIVAIVILCSCFTVYIFILDVISLHIEEKSDLPDYYKQNQGIFIYTILFSLLSVCVLIIGILWFIVYFIVWCCGLRNGERLSQHLALLFLRFIVFYIIWYFGLWNEEKQHLALLIPTVLCVGSTFLSLSFHYQNILIAWSTDPFYASRITVYYGIVLFVYYHTFKNTYLIPIVYRKLVNSSQSNVKSNPPSSAESICITNPSQSNLESTPSTSSESTNSSHSNSESTPSSSNESVSHIVQPSDTSRTESPSMPDKKLNKKNKSKRMGPKDIERMGPKDIVAGLLCVVTVGILLSGFHALNAVFIYYIPINHSIEESVKGVQTIYNGAVVLIGGLIAYNIGWFYYRSKKFSMEKALKKAMKALDKNPFGNVPISYYIEEGWDALSEEDRLKEIMRVLFIHEGKKKERGNTI